jgi:hypothetical protein
MKNKLTFILFFLCFSVKAQFTSIPDVNFEQKLMSLGYDNVINGQVLTSIVSQVTSLYLSNCNISNLSGIQDFTMLTDLNCSNNPLTNVNLSQNVNLTSLTVGGNSFTNINNFNLNQSLINLSLTEINSNNLLLNLSNTNIEYLYLSNITLNNLNITNGSNLGFLIANSWFGNLIINTLSLQGLPNLGFISLDNYSNQNSYVSNISMDNSVSSNLQFLNVSNLNLATISPSFSQIPNLQSLYIDKCLFSSIDLSMNNQLNYLGIGNSPFINSIKACTSFIDSVNVSNCPNLSCVSLKGFLPGINSDFNLWAINAPNLDCIEVQDGDYFSLLFPSNFPSNGINLDPQVNYNTNCNNACSFSCSSASEIPEYHLEKTILKIIDITGRETTYKPNELLFYLYNDGSTEKFFVFE